MKQSTTSKFSTIILFTLFLMIIFSFLLSNYDNFNNATGKDVASVDGTPITTREFQMALNRQIDFLKQMMGGNITEKQIKQMQIRQTVLEQLIQQKHIHNIGKDMGLAISAEEIKAEIKNLPYFKTNNQFDVNLYKNLLAQNGFTPTQFEELIKNDVISKKMEELLGAFVASEQYTKEVVNFKNQAYKVTALKIPRSSLTSLITVTNQEISDFIADENNKMVLEEMYQQNIAQYKKPEEVKARHILLKTEGKNEDEVKKKINDLKNTVNAKNFAELAKKNTEDPSGKDDGGDLGWFSKGRMVPEFEAAAFNSTKGSIVGPIKTNFGFHLIYVEDKKNAIEIPLENVKNDLAKMALQKRKTSELEELFKQTKENVVSLFEKSQWAELTKLQKQTEAQFVQDFSLGQLDTAISGISLNNDELMKLFNGESGTVLDFSTAGSITVVKIGSKETTKTANVEQELQAQSSQFSRKVREDLLKFKSQKAKVSRNASVL